MTMCDVKERPCSCGDLDDRLMSLHAATDHRACACKDDLDGAGFVFGYSTSSWRTLNADKGHFLCPACVAAERYIKLMYQYEDEQGRLRNENGRFVRKIAGTKKGKKKSVGW